MDYTSEFDDCSALGYMNQIEGRLYLGSIDAAINERLLRTNGISHVLSILDSPLELQRFDGFTYKYLEFYDHPNANIIRFLPEALEFIKEGLSFGKVLVHCSRGVSRSASVVILYIMIKNSLEFQQALEYVRSKRPCINPNQGFRKQMASIDVDQYKIYL